MNHAVRGFIRILSMDIPAIVPRSLYHLVDVAKSIETYFLYYRESVLMMPTMLVSIRKQEESVGGKVSEIHRAASILKHDDSCSKHPRQNSLSQAEVLCTVRRNFFAAAPVGAKMPPKSVFLFGTRVELRKQVAKNCFSLKFPHS